jgi:glutathione S-transferase
MSRSPVKVQVSEFIRGPREKVFAAWIRPELAVQWHCPEELKVVSFTNEAKVGGKYHLVMEGEAGVFPTWGEYLEIIPNQKLVMTWGGEGDRRYESVVTVEFSDQDGGTLVSLTHEKLVEEDLQSHREGWQSALRHLKSFIQGAKS